MTNLFNELLMQNISALLSGKFSTLPLCYVRNFLRYPQHILLPERTLKFSGDEWWASEEMSGRNVRPSDTVFMSPMNDYEYYRMGAFNPFEGRSDMSNELLNCLRTEFVEVWVLASFTKRVSLWTEISLEKFFELHEVFSWKNKIIANQWVLILQVEMGEQNWKGHFPGIVQKKNGWNFMLEVGSIRAIKCGQHIAIFYCIDGRLLSPSAHRCYISLPRCFSLLFFFFLTPSKK